MTTSEPTTNEAMEAVISAELEERDPFSGVADATDAHRETHGDCDAFPSRPGHLLGALAGATGAERILEIGGGCGYSTLWLALGAGPSGRVETIEDDGAHVELLRESIALHGYDDRITVHEGRDDETVTGLSGPYDLIFYDAAVPAPSLIDDAKRLLRRGGLLVASNLFLGRYVPDHPDLARGAEFRRRMLDIDEWLTSFANGKLLAVRR